jgi:flagellar L-ring protein precursor FlgH
MRNAAAALAPLLLAAASCSTPPADFMREPRMSPIGSEIGGAANEGRSDRLSEIFSGATRPPRSSEGLFKDQHVIANGDIVTVTISIDDKAQFGNATSRAQSSSTSLSADFNLNLFPTAGGTASPSTFTSDTSSNSKSDGTGNIDRSEKLQVSVAAVVEEVLPNGNLLLSGSQEVRVNYEIRRIAVAGIVRPSDISKTNTISYDKLAEARISYGGRGRLTEVQQPPWGQQIFDAARPF